MTIQIDSNYRNINTSKLVKVTSVLAKGAVNYHAMKEDGSKKGAVLQSKIEKFTSTYVEA